MLNRPRFTPLLVFIGVFLCFISISEAHPTMVPLEAIEPVSDFTLHIDPETEGHEFLSTSPSSYMNVAGLPKATLSLTSESNAERSSPPYGETVDLSFNAFGEEFSFSLKRDPSVFAPNARVTVQSIRNTDYFAPRQTTYTASFTDSMGNDGYAVATILDSGAVDALIIRDGDAVHVQPLDRFEADYAHDSKAKTRLSALHSASVRSRGKGMAAYRLSALPTHDEEGKPLATCGATPDPEAADAATDEHDKANSHAGHTHNHNSPSLMSAPSPILSTGRALLLKRWENCFRTPSGSPSALTTMHVAFAVDYGAFVSMGADEGLVVSRIASVVAQVNAVYKAQLGLSLSVGDLTIMKTPGVHAWNHIGKGMPNSACPTAQALLDAFSAWRKTAHPRNYATVHLITNCFPPPGIVGLAWTGTTCGDYHGSGWSNVMSTLWITVAHEIGHNLNSPHQFGLGGLMDYGDGRLPASDADNAGEYGFNAGARSSICDHLSAAVAGTNRLYGRNDRVPAERCYSSYGGAVCGNHVVEEGEECDAGPEGNACCTAQCKLAPTATCAVPSPCCVDCQALPATTQCGTGNGAQQGYCSRGECVPSRCSAFANAVPCGINPTNNCREKCTVAGRCVSLANDPTAFIVGSYCALSGAVAPDNGEQGVCALINGIVPRCTAKTYQWQVIGKEFGACSCEGKRLKPLRCMENGVNVVGSAFCEGKMVPAEAEEACQAPSSCNEVRPQ